MQPILNLLWMANTAICMRLYMGMNTQITAVYSENKPAYKYVCFTFEGVVIRGWDIAVPTMSVGEISLFTITPDYAYGKEGSGTKIPPNATLRFEIELVCWKGEDVTKDGQVTKIIIKKGEGYDKPNTGAACEGKILVPVSFLHHKAQSKRLLASELLKR